MKTYAAMKDSGVAWLGDIPEDWTVSKVFAHYKRKRIKNHPDEELLSVYRDYGVIPKSSRDDNHNTESTDLSNYQLVEPSDLVTNKMKTWQGSIAISNYRGIVSPAYYIMSPVSKGKVTPRFIHYLLRSPIYISQYRRLSKGIRPGQWDLEYEQFKGLELPLPPYETQERIANYLDEEIALIDNLIAKQQHLLEILEEKRRATITHAVTDGIWPRKKIKYVATKRDQKFEASKDVPYIGLEHVESFSGKRIEAVAQSEPGGLTLGYEAGDVLFGKLRPYLAKVLLTSDSGVCSSEFIVLRANNNLLPEFLKFSLLNEQFIDLINSSTYGAKMPRANWDFISNANLALPPLDKQKQIIDRINQQEQSTDQLQQRILKQINLLKERRTSLISSAVTGKIKV